MNFNSLKFKISVLALLILAVILVIYSSTLFFTFRRTLYQELDDDLTAMSQKVNNAIDSYLNVLGHDDNSFRFSIKRVVSQTGEHPHQNKIEKLDNLWIGQLDAIGNDRNYIGFLDSRGNSLAHSRNFPENFPTLSVSDVQKASAGETVFENIHAGKQQLRMILAPAISLKQPGNVILVATSSARIERILKKWFLIKAISIALILILASFLSQLFAKRILSPVNRIIRAARNINYKDLSIRIKTQDADEEIKDLVNALNEMISRLEQSFKYIIEFSAQVSHELKTPLAIIRGESELVLKEKPEAEAYRKVIKDNLEEVSRMTRIIDDLLLLAKLDYQPEVFVFEHFDLKEFFLEIEESSKILVGGKNIDVRLDFPQESIKIHADKVHLRRLFYNLINNAIKFTPKGGQILIRVSQKDNRAFISVIDTGIGIPKEHLPKIFDRFFHFDRTNRDNFHGNGLGLHIAKSIAKIHSGDIQVQSMVGQGSTFTVSLPLL